MSGFSTRPHSLHEVSRRAAAGEQGFDAAVREFLDVFYAHSGGRTAAIAECPASLSPANLGNVKDAYLSATAEHLARSHGIPVPQWTDLHGWNVRRPFFAGGMESMKALLTVQSPTAFRRRMLFISSDALDRPRRQPVAPVKRPAS